MIRQCHPVTKVPLYSHPTYLVLVFQYGFFFSLGDEGEKNAVSLQ